VRKTGLAVQLDAVWAAYQLTDGLLADLEHVCADGHLAERLRAIDNAAVPAHDTTDLRDWSPSSFSAVTLPDAADPRRAGPARAGQLRPHPSQLEEVLDQLHTIGNMLAQADRALLNALAVYTNPRR
jgi:hypothetical protein